MIDSLRPDDSPAGAGGDPAGDVREFQLPAEALAHLRASAGSAALEAAGGACGHWLASSLRETLEQEDLSNAPTDDFWDALDALLRSRGWGRLRQERIHSGLAVVVAEDWVEGGGGEGQAPSSPGCPFTVGLLSALFSEVAGVPVQVMELGCSARGDEACRFVFGSPAAVEGLRRRHAEGHSEEAALAAL